MKIVSVKSTYVDNAKSNCVDNVKSTNVIKIDNISVRCKNNIKSVHSNNITYELNKLIKLKTVNDTRIIINKKNQLSSY